MKKLNLRGRLCVELLERRDVPSVSAVFTPLPKVSIVPSPSVASVPAQVRSVTPSVAPATPSVASVSPSTTASANVLPAVGMPHAPVVVAPAGGTIDEGGTYGFNCSLSDVDGGPLQVRIQFGNGSPDLAFTNLPSGIAFSVTRQYLQDSLNQTGGAYHGLVTATDSTGLSTTLPFDVKVRNVAPVVTAPLVAINFAPTNPQVARTATISAGFTDPGPDAWTASYVIQTVNGQVVKTGAATVDALRKTANYVVSGLAAGDYYAFVTVADGAAGGAGTAKTFLRWSPAAQVSSPYSYSPYSSYSSYAYPSYSYSTYSYGAYSPYSSYVYPSYYATPSYANTPNGFTVYYFGSYPNFKTYGWDGVSGYYPITYYGGSPYGSVLPSDISYYITRL